EAKYTIGLSLLGSFIISVLSITLGIVFTIDIAVILMVVIVVFTLTASTSFLSSSYTIGITFIVALLLPFTDLIQTQSKMIDRKSTRLNSSHVSISYAVFCLKKNNRL